MYFVDHLYQLGPFCLRSEVIAGKKDECDEGGKAQFCSWVKSSIDCLYHSHLCFL